MSNFPIRLH